jgi:hypothetical protein
MKRLMFSLVVVLSAAVAASAQQVTSIIITTTFNNIGIELYMSAPVPASVVQVTVKKSLTGDAARPVHPLALVNDSCFAGSVFNLEPGTAYEITMSSALFGQDQVRTVTTRAEGFPQATGTRYHVAPGGKDTNAGTTLGTAFATLAKALTVAQPGNIIYLHNGRYYEEVTLPRSGNTTSPIVIRNAPGEHPVLDGRDTTFHPVWTASGSGIYSTPCTAVPRLAYLNGQHLFCHPSLNDLVNNTWSMTGYFADGTHLYVRLGHAGAPTAGDTITVPAYTTAITSGQSYVQIIGLEICYYGLNDFSRGIYFDGASNNLVDSGYFHHCGVGIGLKRAANFNTIQNCRHTEAPVDTWNWSAIKEGTGYYEAGFVVVYGSGTSNRGNVIRHNTIGQVFDGAHLYSDPAPTVDMDFCNNLIESAGDDGIETDGAGRNVRIYGNRFHGFLTGVSVAPAAGGPTYIFRNLLTGWHSNSGYDGYPFKFNVGSALTIDWVYLYHNTCHTAVSGQDGFWFKQYSNWNNIFSRNNIYAGTNYALKSSAAQNPVDFDYDNVYTTHAANFISWQGARYSSVTAFYAGVAQEQHGMSYHPQFVDTAAGDYGLSAGSGLIDKGAVIPGINDGYSGQAPDIGCFEYISNAIPGPGVTGTGPSGPQIVIQPNPCRRIAAITVRCLLPGCALARLWIVDLGGRTVHQQAVAAGQPAIIWDAGHAAPGIYRVLVATGAERNQQNIMLLP